MKRLMTKLAIATTLCSGVFGVSGISNMSGHTLTADAKTFKESVHWIWKYDSEADNGDMWPYSSNTCFVSNSKNQNQLIGFSKNSINNYDNKLNKVVPVKKMTILLSNGKKAYIKKGKLYSSSKKLYTGKISSKGTKDWSTDGKKKVGYIQQSFEATVKNGKINVKTLKIHVSLYGDASVPG